MKQFLKLTKAMFLMHVRNRTTLFWNMVFPIFLLVIYRVAFGDGQVGAVSYMDWVVPGVVVFNILAFGLLGSGTMMVEMREKGVLRRLHASPVAALPLVGSYLLVNVLIALVQCVLVLGFAVVVFGMHLTAAGVLRALPMIIVGIVTFVALGQVVSGVAPSTGMAIAVGQILNFSQMFITDMIMPIDAMPAWIQDAAPYLPAYAVAQLVRPPLLEGTFAPNLGSHLLVTAVYALGAALLAAGLFRWSPKR
ncbi:MAG: ABC transporter permease [Anaerolineae bacterium]|nr:ABC transporter permease [Anaerolineae bacterium]